MKTCTICGLSKPLDDFHKEKKCKQDGRAGKCKLCRKVFCKKYYYKNRKALLAKAKKRRADNPEKYSARDKLRYKKYYEKYKDVLKEKRAASYKKNRKKLIAYNIAYQKKRIKADPNYAHNLKEYRAAYYQKNKEKLKEKLRLKREREK